MTALRKRPRGRVEVELDGVLWRLMPTEVVVRSRLCVGRPLDRETARTLGRELRRAEALTRALRALTVSDRSRRSLEDRLGAAGVAPRPRREVLETLERAGLVDDDRLAAARAQSLAERGYGDAAIRVDLEQRGLAGESVAAALARLEPERQRVRRLVEQRGRDARAARWLAARGFDAGAVEDGLGGFAEES